MRLETLTLLSSLLVLPMLLPAVVFFFTRFSRLALCIFVLYSIIGYPLTFIVTSLRENGSIFYRVPLDVGHESVLILTGFYLLFFLCFTIFYFAIPHIRLKVLQVRLTKQAIEIAILVAVVLVLILLWFLFGTIGIDNYVQSLSALRTEGLAGKGYLIYPVTILVPSLFQFNYVFNARRGNTSLFAPKSLMLLSSLLGLLVGFRGPTIALLLQAYFLISYFEGQPRLRSLAFFSVIVALPLAIFGVLRYAAMEFVLNSGNDVSVLDLLLDSTLTRFRGVEVFAAAYPRIEFGFVSVADSLREFLLAPWPAVLVNKGLSLSEVLTTRYYNDFLYDAGIVKDIYGGVSYGFIVEALSVAGVSGLVLYAFIFAMLFKLSDSTPLHDTYVWVDIVIKKAIIGFSFMLVESTQLGLNAIGMNVTYNLILLFLLWSLSRLLRGGDL